MSWTGRINAMERLYGEPDRRVDVESSDMREQIHLRYYLDDGDEKLAPEELGGRIDQCLADYLSMEIQRLNRGDISIEELKSRMFKVQAGMEDDQALQAFAEILQKGEDLRPASEIYLDLARRHVLLGGRPPASFGEGIQFARVLLHDLTKEEVWETNWDRRLFVTGQADSWLDSRDPDELRNLIRASEKSPISWDALQLICQELADRRDEPPAALLLWYFWASYGHPKRPDEGPAPPHRPRKVGFELRNNEIRYAVDLLALVGMPKAAGCEIVAKALHLAPRTIGAICRKPYSTVHEFLEDAMKSIELSYYSFLYGPDFNSCPSPST